MRRATLLYYSTMWSIAVLFSVKFVREPEKLMRSFRPQFTIDVVKVSFEASEMPIVIMDSLLNFIQD